MHCLPSTSFTVIAGLSYSDEGKGKISYKLCSEFDVVMRVASSWNASHTAVVNEVQHTSFHFPSAWESGKPQIVGPGVYLYLPMFLKEMETRSKEPLFVHERCHVIWERSKDGTAEKFDTIGSGIRPAVIRRLNHEGKTLREVLPSLDIGVEAKERLERAMISDVTYTKMLEGKKVLVEGTNGFLIDNIFGEYPYTTAVNTTPGYLMAMTGFDPSCHAQTIFVGGLINFSLGVHPEMITFEKVGLETVVDKIPEYLRVDFSCGDHKPKNMGPFNFDQIQPIVARHRDAKLYLNFFDIVEEMGSFFYIQNHILHECKGASSYQLKDVIANGLGAKIENIEIFSGR